MASGRDRSLEREGERDGKRTFAVLKPLCTKLLDVSNSSPEDRGELLDKLHQVLKEAHSSGLQLCMEYTLFPLLLLLDAAVTGRSSRSSIKVQLTGKNAMMRIGDRVAEGVLLCVEVILQKCVLETIPQVTMLLQKMTSAAMLSPAEASEEFRHGVVKCLQALLQNLRPCDSPTCMCKLVSSSPFVALSQDSSAFFKGRARTRIKVEIRLEDVNVCPLGYMQSESMSAMIGHLISLLLQIAEAEAARGTLGSGKLRRDALFTLRTLLLKVGTADGTAFFLPGVVSGLTKAIHSSRATKLNARSSFPTATVHTSGAAGWPAAVEEAIRGLTEMLVIVLEDEKNAGVFGAAVSGEKSILGKQQSETVTAALETLQGLSVQHHHAVKEKDSLEQNAVSESSRTEVIVAEDQQQITMTTLAAQASKDGTSLTLRSLRTEEWLDLTTARVKMLLSKTFPLLCGHQSPSVRLAVAEAAAVLLATCGFTLKTCATLFLECLLALACDEWKHVASAAQTYLTLLLAPAANLQPSRNKTGSIDEKVQQEMLYKSLVSILSSMLDQLPRMVFSADISLSVLHVRRLTAAMFFVGPDGVSLHLLDSLGAKQKFIQTLSQCLSFNSTFTGSLEQIILGKPTLYGPVVSEVKSGEQVDDSKVSSQQQAETASKPVEQVMQAEELPTMPPWLSLGSGSKLYHALTYVLRLAGLSAVSDQNRGTSLVSLVELLLANVRQAAAAIGMYSIEVPSEARIAGQEQRMAAVSVCVLNEIIYGASGSWNDKLFIKFGDRMLGKNLTHQLEKNVRTREGQFSTAEQENATQGSFSGISEGFIYLHSLQGRWQAANKAEVRKIISECAGNILHDYLGPEVWDQPTNSASASFANKGATGDKPPLYFFQDTVMLQKVLVDGVGVLGIALDEAFEEGGFLGLVLFPLLEKVASSSHHIRCAAAASLNTLCSHCQYTSVRDLMVANVDLVIDSLCRQFRHLTTYPNAPNLLAAILHHTNASADLLPLLEEPLRGIVLELDVLSRRNHPHFTVPLLRALREITKATMVEAGFLLTKAATASVSCKSLLETESTRRKERTMANTGPEDKVSSSTEAGKWFLESDLEEIMNHFIDRRRCRRAVSAIATSCLVACGPLLASKDPQSCLLALETLEDGIRTLSHAEEAGVHEGKEKEYLEQLCNIIGHGSAFDSLTPASNNTETESKRLLPSMNRIWPHLVLCLKHAHPAVVVHTVHVIASITFECGGDFFTRRFQKDAIPILVKLLREGSTSPEKRKLRSPGFLMPHNNINLQEIAPAAVLKIQVAVLEGITAIAARKKSASALVSSISLIAAWVVMTACHVEALREVATSAVLALSKVDPDLVWIIVVDLVYGSPKREFNGVAPSGFPSFNQIFPPCESSLDALCIKYSAFEGDLPNFSKNAAQHLLTKLEISDL